MSETTRLSVLTALAFVMAGLPMHAQSNADLDDRVRSLGDALENLEAKEGISLGGQFRSQYLHSSIGGDGAVSDRRTEETVEYTSVDFDIRARPNTATQGRLVFRMHQDWRNFFSDLSNPIFSRWISVDGTVKDMFRYNVGDYKQRYSPLTLYTPEINMLHEPYLFSRAREEAMQEEFLGDNNRLLQGVNLNFDAALAGPEGGTLLDEVHFNVMGSRLRNVVTNVGGGNKVTSLIESSPAEKFLFGSNAEVVFLKGLSVGGTFMHIFDKKGTYAGTGRADTAAQGTSIIGGRGGIEAAPILNIQNWNLGLSGEYVLSRDDSAYYEMVGTVEQLRETSIDDAALRAGINGGWSHNDGLVSVGVSVDYLSNGRNFRNELAQSPSFLGQRIMNLDNDPTSSPTFDARNPHYTTFDALYHHVFKFTPSQATNNWHQAPFRKNSYTNSIFTQSELARHNALRLDSSVQLVMPYGPATANRVGIDADLDLGFWSNRVGAKVIFASLEEQEGMQVDTVRVLPKTRFGRMGGGLKFDVARMATFIYPLELSGSFVRSEGENDGFSGDTVFVARKYTSDMVNAGFYYQFWKRAAVLGGYQRIDGRLNASAVESTRLQENQVAGFEYKVADGAYALFTLGRISATHDEARKDLDFSQLLTNLTLRVRF